MLRGVVKTVCAYEKWMLRAERLLEDKDTKARQMIPIRNHLEQLSKMVRDYNGQLLRVTYGRKPRTKTVKAPVVKETSTGKTIELRGQKRQKEEEKVERMSKVSHKNRGYFDKFKNG